MAEDRAPKTWFTNRGQMLQTGIALVAAVFGGINAWPRIAAEQFFSTGAIVFYLIVGFALVSIAVMLRPIWKTAPDSGKLDAAIASAQFVENLRLELESAQSLNKEIERRKAATESDLAKAKEEIAALGQRVEGYEYRDRIAAEEKQRQEARLAKGPKILVSQENNSDGLREVLRFFNDGGPTAFNLQMVGIRWVENRSIQLQHGSAPLPEKHSQEIGIHFHPEEHVTSPLFDFLRKFPGAEIIATIEYAAEGNVYLRDFCLDAAITGKVLWNPRPVRLRD